MNYKRIYDEFIADRKTKQPCKPDYYEVHHIIPRCMGGDDGRNNLIRLTASDHLFAHQLLARAYNNTMHAHHLWGAVLILCRDFLKQEQGENTVAGKRQGSLVLAGGKGLRIRKSLDTARKMRIESQSGENSPSSDKTTYFFKNEDGREFTGTRIAFCNKYGINSGVIPRLMKSEDAKTLDGWSIPDLTITDEEREKRSDPSIYKVWSENGATPYGRGCIPGVTFRGTRKQLKRKTGKGWDFLHYLLDKSPQGWAGWKVLN